MSKLTDNNQRNSILFRICTFTALLSIISCAEFNCDLPSNRDTELNESPVQKGTTELICLHFLPYYVKFSFKIEVDAFSVVSGKHVYEAFLDENLDRRDIDIVVQLSGSTQYSQQIPYLRNEDKMVFPIISILIHTDNGVITKIELEDIKDACVENNIVPDILDMKLSISSDNKIPLCSQKFCKENENENGLCDIKVFVSWMGNDVKGNTMISHSSRINNFAKYNMSSMYNSILEMDNNMQKDASNNFNFEDIAEDVRTRLQTNDSSI